MRYRERFTMVELRERTAHWRKTLRGAKLSAFTMVEMIAAIAIVAILVAVMVPTVGNFVRQSQETADRQTLAVLNDAINRYKMQGGDVSALTVGKPYANLLETLRTPISWHGVSHQFLRGSSEDFDTAITIEATGSAHRYQLTTFNSYNDGTSGEAVVSGGEQVPNPAFVSTWRTTSAGESITLPTYNGSTYNATVDWGDGSSSEITSPTDPDITHIYASAGDYTVTITGTFERIYFPSGGSEDKIIHISNWGDLGYTSMNRAFYGCSNLTISATDYAWTSAVDDMSYMFWGAPLANPITTNWDTSNVLSMLNMFRGATSANPDTSNWDVSSVEDMRYMFYGATSANPDTSNWDVSSLQYTAAMFRSAASADPDVSNWNTGSLVDCASMFWGASSANPNVSNWNVSNIESMQYMFAEVSSVTSDFTNWTLSSATSMENMFSGVTLPVSSYSTLLNRCDATNPNSNVTLGGGSSQYNSTASAARANLIARGWTITDGGQTPMAPDI